ncbi:unnamed protein product [Symbiodinium natans]|uniref:Uncharacterized protein n=1 Tax=Symbiodinium natans TaxID=878477 RepID=A0A812S5N4_9DINO|nr:unnamed protein product [Symbiodinium natans]
MPQPCGLMRLGVFILLTQSWRSSNFLLSLPVHSHKDDARDFWRLTWNTTETTAERLVEKLQTIGGEGLHLHLDLTAEGFVTLTSGKDFLQLEEVPGDSTFVRWEDLAGHLHGNLASYRPDLALDLELAPFLAGRTSTAEVGLFLLVSPTSKLWRFLPLSVRRVWTRLQNFRLHVMVHYPDDWQPSFWRRHLGSSYPALGGIHWCGAVNRFPALNPWLAERRPWDTYFNKVFAMIAIAEHQRYRWILSVDDDVILPPFALMSMLSIGQRADEANCFAALPLTQNGIPATELFATMWMQLEDRMRLFRCFSDCSGHFCNENGSLMTLCRPNGSRQSTSFVEVPDPWNEMEWYRTLSEQFEMRWWKNHPVAMNQTCMLQALEKGLKELPLYWFADFFDSQQLIVDDRFSYPYFANNVFLIRTDKYREVIQHSKCCFRTDEVTMNVLRHEQRSNLCFVRESFGIHPAWGNFGQDIKHSAEEETISWLKRMAAPVFNTLGV